MEELIIYGIVILISIWVVYYYVRKGQKQSRITEKKVEKAKEDGLFEPLSLHPYIDLNTCIGSGACITACPEKDILGIVDGKATVINSVNCIGHGACFHSRPVEAISLRIGTETRGVELPHVSENYETNIAGVFIAGELGGMGLIKNSVDQGRMAAENIAKSNKPKLEGVLDLLIIGAGPAGIAASLTAKKHGLSFKTLEQDSLGGTVYTFPRAKIVMTNPMDLPLYGKIKLYNTSKDELIDLWKDALGKNDISITEKTKVEKIIPLKDGSFKVMATTGEEFLANHVLIAIGRRGSPRKLDIPGEESTKVAYRLLDPELIQQQKVIVVGAGDSAAESAMMLMDNNEVTLAVRKATFSKMKPANREKLTAAIESGKINGMFNTNLVCINEKDAILKTVVDGEEETKIIDNDLVYIFAGGLLPTGFLKNIGIEITKRFGQIVKKH